MMTKFSKILVLLLTLTLIFSAFATFAFAEDGANQSENSAGENTETASGAIETDFDFSRFVDSLQYMWKGMLCIFIVIGVIILSIYGLNKLNNALMGRKSKKQ